MSLETLAKTLGFAKEHDVKTICLLGGEPTLHPDILEMARMVKEQGFNLVMTTNFDNLEALYTLDPYVDSFNLSYYGQKEFPDLARFQHANLTVTALIYRTGLLSTREKLDAYIDKYGDKYVLRFGLLSNINEFTEKNHKVDYLDDLSDCTWVVLLNQIAGCYYRGHLIKRSDIVLNHMVDRAWKGHVDGRVNQSWDENGEMHPSRIC
jgi:organic radical activating enzyme